MNHKKYMSCFGTYFFWYLSLIRSILDTFYHLLLCNAFLGGQKHFLIDFFFFSVNEAEINMASFVLQLLQPYPLCCIMPNLSL